MTLGIIYNIYYLIKDNYLNKPGSLNVMDYLRNIDNL
jgi:hypothetical protein